jgi:hypothetical protein
MKNGICRTEDEGKKTKKDEGRKEGKKRKEEKKKNEGRKECNLGVEGEETALRL